MPQEDYSKALNAILAMAYQQRLSLLSVLAESLQEKEPAPASVTVSSVEVLCQKLCEGLSDIESGRVISAVEVNKRLREKYEV